MLGLLLALAVEAAPAGDIRWVHASVAKVRVTADAKSAVRATLPIGVEVRVLRESGTAVEVEALDGARGFVGSTALGKQAPVLAELLDRQALEQAAALAPSDLDVIERFAAAQRNAETSYLARKGWVAAKRRSLSWDGPLYPIDDGRARFPVPCSAHEEKPDGPDGMGRGRVDAQTGAERRRAFRWVSSGKVVSVSERGYTTEHLKSPRCDGERLAYPTSGKRGALVPSWMVAGFEVTPVREGVSKSARWKLELSVEERRLRVRAATFSTAREAVLELSRTAEPVATFSDGPEGFTVLLRGPECAPRESTVFLVRARVEGDALKLEEGRPWGCGQTGFTGLEGEPRDVSREAMLEEGWKR